MFLFIIIWLTAELADSAAVGYAQFEILPDWGTHELAGCADEILFSEINKPESTKMSWKEYSQEGGQGLTQHPQQVYHICLDL